MKIKRSYFFFLLPVMVIGYLINHYNCYLFSYKKLGQKIDSLNGVYVYYNGSVGYISGRNLTKDGYNLGLKYQCVEFVKRYYYEYLQHRMPNSYGNAIDFFDVKLVDGQFNSERGLYQFSNPSFSKPCVNDILIYRATSSNKYGHVSIIAAMNGNVIEVIQQNAGRCSNSRAEFALSYKAKKWKVENPRIIGWLRKRE